MRIIGGHDYYDTSMGLGHDPKVFFKRGDLKLANHELEGLGIFPARFSHRVMGIKTNKIRYRYRWGGDRDVVSKGYTHTFSFLTVIVCGKRYQGIRVASVKGIGTEKIYYIWALDKLYTWLEMNELKLSEARADWRETTLYKADDYFEPREVSQAILNLLIEKRWSILLHNGGNEWLIDQPVLKTVEFAKVIPPNILFQELDMWLGGRIGLPGNVMVEVSDEVRAAKHGMDKTSFRKPPSKKRLR